MVLFFLIQTIFWLLISYVCYCCFLFMMQRHILFPRIWIPTPPGVSKGVPGLERMWLNTNRGDVEAWYIPAPMKEGDGPAPAVLFAHGNGELIDYWPKELNNFTRLGMSLMLVEYPGYGRSRGSPSEESITETFTAAFDLLSGRKEVDTARIVLFGRSLGGGAVCALASRRPSAALILQSTFTSVRSFASSYFAPAFLIRDPFDNLKVVKAYSGPILIMHGTRDTVVPYAHGVALHRAAPRSELITYACGHNDCPPKWSTFWRDIESFLYSIGILERHGKNEISGAVDGNQL